LPGRDMDAYTAVLLAGAVTRTVADDSGVDEMVGAVLVDPVASHSSTRTCIALVDALAVDAKLTSRRVRNWFTVVENT
jgi:hypothetical protein